MNFAARLNERDEVNMHLNEELCAYDRITKESEETIARKNARIDQLARLLKKHHVPIPPEEEVLPTPHQQHAPVDAVYLEGGELTYNITANNLARAQEEMAALKQVNGQQKQEIVRLKEELKAKEGGRETGLEWQSSGVRPEEGREGLLVIQDSINSITKGLQCKENTDMKSIINEIFKIKKVVASCLE